MEFHVSGKAIRKKLRIEQLVLVRDGAAAVDDHIHFFILLSTQRVVDRTHENWVEK